MSSNQTVRIQIISGSLNAIQSNFHNADASHHSAWSSLYKHLLDSRAVGQYNELFRSWLSTRNPDGFEFSLEYSVPFIRRQSYLSNGTSVTNVFSTGIGVSIFLDVLQDDIVKYQLLDEIPFGDVMCPSRHVITQQVDGSYLHDGTNTWFKRGFLNV